MYRFKGLARDINCYEDAETTLRHGLGRATRQR